MVGCEGSISISLELVKYKKSSGFLHSLSSVFVLENSDEASCFCSVGLAAVTRG